jgi:glycosyltransferase involved in cell wall biosynthesis
LPYRVCIVQLALTHYNLPLFALLHELLGGRLCSIAGPYFFHRSPVSVTDTPGLSRIRTHNLFIRNKWAIQWPLPEEVASSEIAVLEFNPRILSNLWIIFRRRRRRRPVILWGHGLSRRAGSSRLAGIIKKWLVGQVDAVILYGDAGMRDFLKLGLPPEKLFVAHNSVDVQSIRSLANRAPPELRRHVLYIGRLLPAKKVALLIDGFARASRDLPPEVRLIIVGDGPERKSLTARAAERGISDRVEFMGEITDEKALARHFARSLISVSPGYIGLSAIHSMAYGVPILAADAEPHSPEIEALVAGRNCEFFKAGDEEALAEALEFLLSQPEKLQVMGLAALEDVTAKYSLQHMASVFMEAFEYVIRR